MQITVNNAQGLKRELQIVIGAGELAEKLANKLVEMKDQVRLKGFRPGKVPVDHLKRLYGRSVMAEVVQQSVNEANEKAIEERKERVAFQPDIKFTEDTAEIERVMAGAADLTYTVSFEVLPVITIADLSKITLDKPVAKVADSDIDKGIETLAQGNMTFTDEPGRVAVDGDRLVMDYVGKIDGTAFEGGTAEGANVVIGRGGFIPGFEEGLKGLKSGDTRDVKATFPEGYPVKELAGKEAVFSVVVKDVGAPQVPVVDDAFAATLGVESLAKLRELIGDRIKQEFDQMSRTKVKRGLLDALEKTHDFTLPEGLVDNEFDGIWRQVTESLAKANRTFEDEGKTEEGARLEYRGIAERRVRLGLVLSEIGEKNEIKVADDELRRALMTEARQYPGEERKVIEFYQKNPQALASLRAPLYEDKVVDFILELVKPNEKIVTREELMANDEGDDQHIGHDHGHAHHTHDHAHDHDHDHQGHDHQGHDHHGHDHHGHDHKHD